MLINRDIFAADDWSVVKAGSAEGHFTMHVDRDNFDEADATFRDFASKIAPDLPRFIPN